MVSLEGKMALLQWCHLKEKCPCVSGVSHVHCMWLQGSCGATPFMVTCHLIFATHTALSGCISLFRWVIVVVKLWLNCLPLQGATI